MTSPKITKLIWEYNPRLTPYLYIIRVSPRSRSRFCRRKNAKLHKLLIFRRIEKFLTSSTETRKRILLDDHDFDPNVHSKLNSRQIDANCIPLQTRIWTSLRTYGRYFEQTRPDKSSKNWILLGIWYNKLVSILNVRIHDFDDIFTL